MKKKTCHNSILAQKASGEDILCQVGLDSLPDLYTVHSVTYQSGSAVLTISIPEPLLQDFLSFLEATISLSQYIKFRTRVGKASEKAKSAAEQELRREEHKRLSSYVVSIYDSFLKRGSTTRQAIRQTKDHLNNSGHHFTNYTIELILRNVGRMRKANRRD